MLRAAAVGGGAYLAGKSAARRSDEREARESDQEARIADLEAQQSQGYAPPPPQAPPAPQQAPAPQGTGSSMIDQLNELTAMHNSGALTDEEFAAAKAKLLS